MVDKMKNISPIKLVVAVFLIILICYTLFCTVLFSVLQYYYSSGKLVQMNLTPSSFNFVNIEQNEGVLNSLNEDSQLTLDSDMYIKNVSLTVEYESHPGEVFLYYADTGVGAFSQNKRVSFFYTENSTYFAQLIFPRAVQSIRIDPTMFTDLDMEITQIIVNERQTYIQILNFTPVTMFNIILFTLISSCFIGAIVSLIKAKIKK